MWSCRSLRPFSVKTIPLNLAPTRSVSGSARFWAASAAMPSAVEKSPAPFLVPTVDIGPYLSDPSSSAAKEIISTIRSACLSTGFFQITGHGIPREVQRSTFDAAAAFFSLPLEEKKKLDITKWPGFRGYDLMGTQSYDDSLPDLKESYFFGPEIPADDPRVKARRFGMGPNVWPSPSVLPAAAFKEPVEAYYKAVKGLTLKVLEMIARTLPYGPHVFDEFVSNDPAAPLRLLHYPPQKVMDKRQLGASAHTDFGAITMLLQDDNAGLQVLNSATDEWVPVPPRQDAYVVNIGDMLSMWTNGEYKSSWHRVLNQSEKDRYSIVFFFDGNLDCPLDPLDGSKVKGKSITVEEHMNQRLSASYGKAG